MNKMYFLTLSVLPIHLFLDVDCRFLISMSQKKFSKFTFLGLFAKLLTFMVEMGNFLRPFQHQSMYKTQSSGSENFFSVKKRCQRFRIVGRRRPTRRRWWWFSFGGSFWSFSLGLPNITEEIIHT